MAQPEKRENSVLFSLRELKQIEESRVQEEASAVAAAEQARIRQREMEEQQRRAAEEAAIRAQQEEERRVREEHERRVREDALRLQEAEARARVEAHSQLEAQRLAQEMEIRRQEASKKRPTWLIATVGVLVLAAAGLTIFLVQRSGDADAAAKQAQIERENREKADKAAALARAETEELQRQVDDLQKTLDELDKESAAAQATLAAAKTDAERKAAQDKLDSLGKKKSETRTKLDNVKGGKGGGKGGGITISQKCKDNPLDC